MFSVNAVNAQSGYWLLPRKPSCAKMFSDTTTIANQRAQVCPAPNPSPATASSTPQMIITQPQAVRSTARNPALVTTKYSSSNRAMKPSKMSINPIISNTIPAKPIHPAIDFSFITASC